LLLNTHGKVSEGPGMCFFMVRDGRMVTPTLGSDILESITRDTVIDLAPECSGMAVEARDIDRSELVAAAEAFFCGSAWEVTPIVEIDRQSVGSGTVGPAVRALRQAYFDLVGGVTDAHPEWRTPVYVG